MKFELIIFDMDGTLVQSESCASQALLDVIPALSGSAQEITALYRGMRLADIFADIESRISGAIPNDVLNLYREREAFLAGSMITPSVGVETTLSELDVKKCIASNAPIEKTKRSLDLCGLSHFFETGIFSAYEVQAWKPDPKLFIHAANSYAVDPAKCLVVEDSKVGIEAALAAGMTPILYDPHDLSESSDGVTKITRLTELLEILG